LFGVSALATVMHGSGGWYYWLGDDGLSLDRHYRGVAAFPQSYVDATIAELIRRRDWLAARSIAYVVAVVPEKFTIYPEFLPAWVGPPMQPSPHDRVVVAASGSGIALLDLRPALREADGNASTSRRIRTGTIWGLVGYEAIMRSTARVASADWPDRGRAQAAVCRGRRLLQRRPDRHAGLPAASGRRPRAVRKVRADGANRCARRVEARRTRQRNVRLRPSGLPRAVVYRDSMAFMLIRCWRRISRVSCS
jgi:hypothetical protein